MILKALYYPFHRKRLDKASEGGKLYQVYVEKDAQFKPSQYNNFFDSLYTIYQPKNPFSWLSFEFHGTPGGIRIYTWLSSDIGKEFIQANINSIHQSAEVMDVKEKDDYARFARLGGRSVTCSTMELDRHYLFNILQSDGEKIGADLMASLCASMQNLDDDEEVSVQFLLRPVHYRKLNVAQSHYELYRRFGRVPSKLNYPFAKYNPYLEVPKALLGAVQHTLVGSAGKLDVHHSMNSISKKLEAGVYFDMLIRVVTVHPTLGKSNLRSSTVLSSFAPAIDKNRLRPHTISSAKEQAKFLKAYEKRRIHTYPLENYVTSPELATLIHFPSKDIPGIVRLRAKKMPVPEGVYTYNSMEEAWKDKAMVFGISKFRGRTKYVAFKDIKMLMQHCYCIGGTGSGKSYWLSFLSLQVVRHAGLTFFDVKGDIIDDFMRHLPKSEWDRVVYIDLFDNEYFLPFNILQQKGMTVYNLATMIVGTFVKCFSDGSIKEHSQNVLRNALIAVISTDPEGSLLEVYRMFTDENYLDLTITRLKARREFPDITSYWEHTFKAMKPTARKSECSSIVNKLALITQNERPRFMLSQKENSLNWRKMMDEKAIILVNLSLGRNEDQVLTFFGTLLTDFISKATFSRDDILRDARVPHIFVLDEFERFVHQEADMQKFLEMARSYGLGLILAHQSVEQVPSKLLGLIKDNTFSQVGLLMGEKSASDIQHIFPGVDAEDLANMLQYTGYGKFKKLSPHPFTFDNPSMEDYFESASWDDIQKWKIAYKKRHYNHKLEIHEEIMERYQMVADNPLNEDDTTLEAVRKGKASGRLTRKGANKHDSNTKAK